MNTLDACKLIVRHFPGGIDVVALRLAKSPSTLEKELRSASGYKLGVLDAEAISCMAIEAQSPHCHAYVNATAAQCGGFIKLEVRDDMAPQPLSASVASLVKEASDVLMAATEALADGTVSDNDRKAVDKQIEELQAQLQSVRKAVAAAHKAGTRGEK